LVEKTLWKQPSSYNVGLFTDLTLYAEALQLAEERGLVTAPLLQQELSQRFLRLLLVKRQSPRVAKQLVRELRQFGWLKAAEGLPRPPANAPHVLTPEGRNALAEAQRDKRTFRRHLTVCMHQVYIVPGWFVARLWQINSEGGEVIVPAPIAGWKPESRKWADWEWDDSLREQTIETARQARLASETAFPVDEDDWLPHVQRAWSRLSSLSPRTPQSRKPSYQPRRRLAHAMREAAINLLFGPIPYRGCRPDFPGHRKPLQPRTFMAWCPRLESLELLFYTDWHPGVPGRLLFPASVFRSSRAHERFEKVPEIVDPEGRYLYLHQPQWSVMRDAFWATLATTHRRVSLKARSLYVSLLDVRDEVCRQLRLSAITFDEFLDNALREPPRSDFSISLETDIREEQRSGYGLLRRPVYIRGVPHALIAVARLPEDERSL